MNSMDRIIAKVEDVELALSRLIATQSEDNLAINELLICMTSARIVVEKQHEQNNKKKAAENEARHT